MESSHSIVHDKVLRSLTAAHCIFQAIPCDPTLADTAAFCQAYGYKLEDSANTILVATKSAEPVYAACLVLAHTKLDVNKTVRKLLGVKKLSFASSEDTIAITGMEIGGVTIVGLSDIPQYIDSAVMIQDQIIIGGGNRSSKIIMSPTELLKIPGMTIVEGLALPK